MKNPFLEPNRKVRVDRIGVASHNHRITLDGMGMFVTHNHEIDIDHPEHGHNVKSGTYFGIAETLLDHLRQAATPRRTK